MPESPPPKRITRARAKAAEKEPDTKGAKGAKKVATSTKATTTTARTSKRKTRADDVEEDRVVGIDVPTTTIAVAENKPETAKVTRGRSRKVAVVTVETAEEVIIAEPMPSQASEPEVPKTTRGRARKAVAGTTKPEEGPEKVDATKAKRAPRGRAAAAAAAAATTVSTAAITKAPAKPAAPRKRVTFQDDLDKENVIPSSDDFKQPSSEKTTRKAAGLRAKPVRRPASGRATRGSKKAPATEADKTEEREELPPLSPKKAKQIPVVQPASDEDELSGEKTPRKARGKPSYGIASACTETGERNAPKLDFSTSLVAMRQEKLSTADLLSSSKGLGSSLLATPARRPPSPVKNMLDSSVQPFVMAPPSTFKNSLFQSPARRPIHSPVKGGLASGSPKKFMPTAASTLEPLEAPSDTTGSKASVFLPPKGISSPLRAAKSPERPVSVRSPVVDVGFEQENIVQESPALMLSAIELDPNRRKTPIKPAALKSSSAKPTKSSIPIKAAPTPPKTDGFGMGIDNSGPPDPPTVGESGQVERSTTPPGLPDQPPSKAFHLGTPRATRQIHGDSDSEDELHSESQDYSPTPLSHRLSAKKLSVSSIPTPTVTSRNLKCTPMRSAAKTIATTDKKLALSPVTCVQPSQVFSITPLASRFGTLAVRSPDKAPHEPAQARRGLFSPTLLKPNSNSFGEVVESTRYSILKSSSFFDEEMLALEQQQGADEEPTPTVISGASQEYGDENAIPIDPILLATCGVSAAVATPVKMFSTVPHEIHTVQKVPLKPAADDMPVRSGMKRSASPSGSGSPRKGFIPQPAAKADTTMQILFGDATLGEQPALAAQPFCTPTKSTLSPQRTPGTGAWSSLCSPARTPRQFVNPKLLENAVVYVDVHTAEGADASGIFVELLTQMGARCVKQWNWNPSNNVVLTSGNSGPGFGIGGTDEGIRDVGTPSGSKIGITHVVFKDGGVRTLQKVRESRGVVLCVGVNWVLDCEREQKWLNEEDYAVDISNTPRGGQRRRKSMEPRALANINGNLVPYESPGPKTAMSPTKEFLTFSSPAPPVGKESKIPKPPVTPPQQTASFGDDMDMSPLSPTTPYFLKPKDMVQKTCPPKAVGKGGFIALDDEDEGVRQRLLLARRKSLQWAPKVASPLGKAVSYGM